MRVVKNDSKPAAYHGDRKTTTIVGFYRAAVHSGVKRELKKTTKATATETLLNKRFNEQNNSCARAL